jgi:hypothetical protein
MKRSPTLTDIPPARIFEDVANSIPAKFHESIMVIGSLAAGYHYFGSDREKEVRTKDIDCMVVPRVAAVSAGQEITQQQWRWQTY